jgi:hypothetical protein
MSQITLFKKLSVPLGEDTADELLTFIVETKERMDDKFLTQKDKVELIKEIHGVSKAIDQNFKWGVGMFITLLITLFVLLFKVFI